jgi:hypothetical protein
MFYSKNEILSELESTLNQLIHNIQTLNNVDIDDISSFEMVAMNKTQESLLVKCLHISEQLKTRKKGESSFKEQTIHDKLHHFGKLNADFLKKISSQKTDTGPMTRKKPRIGKNRKRLKIG